MSPNSMVMALLSTLVLSTPTRAGAQDAAPERPASEEETVNDEAMAEESAEIVEQDQAPAVAQDQAPAVEEPAVEEPRITEARQRIASAEDAYEREDYEAALTEFETTAALLEGHSLRFRVLFNMGRCQEKLFRYQDALVSYRAFLSNGGTATEQAPEVRAKLELLEGLLGTIQLSVDVRGYEVWVNDRLIGRSLTELLLPSGTHAVEVRSDGYVQNQQEVLVAARRDVELSFEMTRLADEFEGVSPAYFVTSAVVAVLALAAGATVGGIARARSDDIELRSPPLATPEESADIRRLAVTADILFGAAALGATAAIIFALFTDWGDEESDALSLRPVMGFQDGGVVLEGSF